MGAVAHKPVDLAELFIEGDSANGDGRVRIRDAEFRLSDQQALDLLTIADTAHTQFDYAIQYAALLAAMLVATPAQRRLRRERYRVLFQELPSTVAAALADLFRDDIALAKQHGNGIANDPSVAQQAQTRAATEYLEAAREHQRALGEFDDDVSLIVTARIRVHAAGVINHGYL